MRQTYGFSHRAVRGVNPPLGLLFSLGATEQRGVAQLIARSVWDREVEGLSPFTPTIEKIRHSCRIFSMDRGRDSTLDFLRMQK